MQNIPTIIEQTISVLSEKFGVVGTRLWAVLIKQSYIDGWTNIAGTIIFLILIIGGIILFKRGDKEYKMKDKWDHDPSGWWISRMVVLTFSSIGIMFSITGAINDFANPEYQAIQTILSATSQQK